MEKVIFGKPLVNLQAPKHVKQRLLFIEADFVFVGLVFVGLFDFFDKVFEGAFGLFD